MSKKIELLAPGGDIDSIKAAIIAGADAIYCGLNKFNARNRAENISFDDLNGILRLAHRHSVKVFLTLNILIVETEIPDLIRLLNKLANTSIDGIIIQDLGLFYILNTHFKELKIHASTQLTTHNRGQIEILSGLSAERVNLSRELNCDEIEELTAVAHQNKMLTEVFVHGSYCVSYSGICYMSSVHGGNSGNRGRCSQPCRDEYLPTQKGKTFPLNLKDNSAFLNLPELVVAGVDSLKIEGRIKKYHYVYSVVKAYQNQLKNISNDTPVNTDDSTLFKVFNRSFSTGFLAGKMGGDLFIDNSRDNSSTHLANKNGGATKENIDKAEVQLYAEKGEMRNSIKKEINEISPQKAPLTIVVSGKANAPLKLEIQTPDNSFVLLSKMNLATNGAMPLDKKMLLKRFKAFNETEYFIDCVNLENVEGEVFMPFNELTDLKKRILFILRNSKAECAPVQISPLYCDKEETLQPSLSILIDSAEDLVLSQKTSATFYFKIPSHFSDKTNGLKELFTENEKLIPWFPSVLIGHNFEEAKRFLQETKPKQIVSNNLGIAYEAIKLGIPWIAGPFLNTTNSYTLKCLKENLSCAGAFISNELNRQQIQRIKKPDNFQLYYSIYNPITLMSSRQCLFQTTSGCEKNTMDVDCLPNCKKATSITNLKQQTFFIQKSEGNYNVVYNHTNFLNTDIVKDIPNHFSNFLIDLSGIKTATQTGLNKMQVISLFAQLIRGESGLEKQLKNSISPTSCTQYKKGI